MKEKNDIGINSSLNTIQIIFIILKYFNLINWSWYKVFIPTFISIVFVFVYIIFYIFRNYFTKINK